jgi:hypothetical protein
MLDKRIAPLVMAVWPLPFYRMERFSFMFFLKKEEGDPFKGSFQFLLGQPYFIQK